MALKRLSDVTVGQVIKIGERKYKLASTAPFGYLVQKEVLPGIFAERNIDVSSVVTNYNGAFNTLVEVVEGSSAPKSDLTSQLRQQQKQKSLTDSLRAQQAASDEDEEVDYDDEDDWDSAWDEEEDEEEEVNSFIHPTFSSHTHAQISAFDAPQPVIQFDGRVPAIEEAKKASLSANLKAQQAQQTGQQARLDAVIAKAKVTGVQTEVGYLGKAVSNLSFEVNRVAENVHDAQDYAYAVSDVAHDALRRVEAIEHKQFEEEKKMNLQNELNRKLAEQKRQNELQAQLNQKLNQKSGGNGTMKNLLGNVFNFGKVEGKFAFPVTGGIALRKGLTNSFVAYNKDTKELTDVSGLTLKFDVPAFKLPVAATAVEVGDLVIHNGEYVYVTKKADGYLEVLNPEKGVNGSVVPTKNAILGAAFYTVVKTLDAAGQGGFNPLLLMALGKGNKDELLPLLLATGGIGNGANAGSIDPTMLMLLGDDVEDLLPLVLMQQGGAVGQGFNPLMFLAMNKGGKSKDLLPLLLATGGLNGGTQAGAINPMMFLALGDGEMDLTTLALMGGFGGQGLFGQAPAVGTKEVKKDK